MPGVQLVIDARVEQPEFERVGRQMVVALEKRVAEGDTVSADLVGVLVVGEEKRLVFLQRAAEGEAALAAHERRLFEGSEKLRVAATASNPIDNHCRITGALQTWEGGHMLVAEEEEPAAMKGIAAGARDHVDGSDGGPRGGEVKVESGNLELLHALLREILRGSREPFPGRSAVDSDYGFRCA